MAASRWAIALAVAVAAISASAVETGAASAAEVRVLDTSGPRPVPCAALDLWNPQDPRGGCSTDMFSGSIDIVIRSVIGDMLFGHCTYEHDMLVDARGRTRLLNIQSGGDNPCNDMGVCEYGRRRPWKGQIEAGPDGRLTHVIQACLDTCMGQFVGELRLSLERIDGRWIQTAERALVGDSGYQIDGSWRMRNRDIDIRPAGGSAGGETAGVWRLTGDPVGWPLQLG
ncbi:MAG TPA: hypothetical protein VHF88_05865 [Thermoleophilaceae bacterium]|nr:hypothetical protein [Thermoleophilaceae bacterium]